MNTFMKCMIGLCALALCGCGVQNPNPSLTVQDVPADVSKISKDAWLEAIVREEIAQYHKEKDSYPSDPATLENFSKARNSGVATVIENRVTELKVEKNGYYLKMFTYSPSDIGEEHKIKVISSGTLLDDVVCDEIQKFHEAHGAFPKDKETLIGFSEKRNLIISQVIQEWIAKYTYGKSSCTFDTKDGGLYGIGITSCR